jgi:thiamine kinase-like enzyme
MPDAGRVLQALRPIAGRIGIDLGQIRIEALASSRRRTFKVTCGERVLAVRLPDLGQRGAIDGADRRAEGEAARAAQRLGVGPEVVFHDPSSGVLVTGFIGAGATLSAGEARADPAALDAVALVLARVHGGDRRVTRSFDPCAAIERYRETLARLGRTIRLSSLILGVLDRIRVELAASPGEARLCHGDPVPENFVRDGVALRLIDWEYAGMGDPAWDLAYLATEAGLDGSQCERLRVRHGERVLRRRLDLHLVLAPLVVALWTAGQNDADAGRVDDRLTLAETRAAAVHF